MTLPRNLAGIGGPVKIDQAKFRKAFGSVRVWASQAKVLNEQFEDDSGVDVLVRLVPSGVECFAKMAPGYAGADFGEVWRPAEDDTVLCLLQQEEDGDLGAVFIVGALHSSARKKPTGDSSGKRRTVIRDGDDMEVNLSGGGTLKLAVVGAGQVNITTAGQTILVDAGAAGVVDLRGKEVAGTTTGAGAVPLAKVAELNVTVAALNAFITIFLSHIHGSVALPAVPFTGPPLTAGVPDTPKTGTTALKGA